MRNQFPEEAQGNKGTCSGIYSWQHFVLPLPDLAVEITTSVQPERNLFKYDTGALKRLSSQFSQSVFRENERRGIP